jgi:hypothetical protein
VTGVLRGHSGNDQELTGIMLVRESWIELEMSDKGTWCPVTVFPRKIVLKSPVLSLEQVKN